MTQNVPHQTENDERARCASSHDGHPCGVCDGPAPAAEIAGVEWTAAGQVITYQPERSSYHCREGWAISNDYGRFVDTFWMSMSDAHVVTADELATAEHQFWLDDYRELDRHSRGTPDEWAKYAPEDRRRIPSQHGLQARYFVRHEAGFDLPTQIENAVAALRQAEDDAESAQRRLKRAQERVDELRDLSNPPGSTASQDPS